MNTNEAITTLADSLRTDRGAIDATISFLG